MIKFSDVIEFNPYINMNIYLKEKAKLDFYDF